MKNGKKISALIMILFSVDVAPKGFWDFLTRSKPVSTEGAKKPDESFQDGLKFHLEAHSNKQIKHTIPTSFQKLPSIADPLTEFGEQGDVTINEISDSTTESNQLSPEEKKALLKLNKQRSFFSFFKKKLPSGEKGLTQQQQFSEDQNTFIKIVIKKLLIDPKSLSEN